MLRSPNGRYMRSQRDISDKCSCRPHAAGHFSRKCIYRYQVFIILEILTVNLLCCTGTAVSHCCIENLSKIEITGLLSRLVCMIIWHPDQLPVIFDYFWARNTFLTTDLHGKSTQTLRRLERALCHNRRVLDSSTCCKPEIWDFLILQATGEIRRPLLFWNQTPWSREFDSNIIQVFDHAVWLPFNRVVLFLITLVQVTITSLDNYYTQIKLCHTAS